MSKKTIFKGIQSIPSLIVHKFFFVLFLLIAFILFSPKEGKAFYKKIKAKIRNLRKKDSS